MAEEKMGGRIKEWELSCTRRRLVATIEEEWWENSWTRTTEDARRGRGEWKGSRIRQWEGGRTTARKQETDRGQQTISRGKYFSRGKVMVNLSHSKLKRKGHTEEKYVPAAIISRKQFEVSSRKHTTGKNADALIAFKEINRSLLKVDKSQKIGNGISAHRTGNTLRWKAVHRQPDVFNNNNNKVFIHQEIKIHIFCYK